MSSGEILAGKAMRLNMKIIEFTSKLDNLVYKE